MNRTLRLAFSLSLCALTFSSKAQFVTIPDANFRTYLSNNFPACLNGSLQLDTTCSAVVTATSLTVINNIQNLSGIQYFDALTYLSCEFNGLTSLPALPPSLDTLLCDENSLSSLPPLQHLSYLNCEDNLLFSLPALPASLKHLIADGNQISSLPTLPAALLELRCVDNSLTSLPVLPAGLLELACGINQLTSLPTLPASLDILSVYQNNLHSLPTLPATLGELDCEDNQLTLLPTLPSTLDMVACSGNQLSCLPALPDNLSVLYASGGNTIACLPNLPSNPSFYSDISQTVCTSTYNPNSCTLVITSSVQKKNDDLHIHPNPSNGIVTVLSVTSGIGSLILLNAEGTTVKNFQEIDFSVPITFDLSALPKGLYILQGFHGEEMSTEKIILN